MWSLYSLENPRYWKTLTADHITLHHLCPHFFPAINHAYRLMPTRPQLLQAASSVSALLWQCFEDKICALGMPEVLVPVSWRRSGPARGTPDIVLMMVFLVEQSSCSYRINSSGIRAGWLTLQRSNKTFLFGVWYFNNSFVLIRWFIWFLLLYF